MGLFGDERLEEEEQSPDAIAGLDQQDILDILAEGAGQAAVGRNQPGTLQIRCPSLACREHDQHIWPLRVARPLRNLAAQPSAGCHPRSCLQLRLL